MENKKRCSKCHEMQPIENFWVRKSGKRSGDVFSWCKTCVMDFSKEWKHRTGRQQSMETNRDCSVFLGVNIAERALSRFFDHIERMVYGNRGFDFICGRGYKIDVKSGCVILERGKSPYWKFTTRKNEIADYFLLLAFDSRELLEPQHVWLVPSATVNDRSSIKISNIASSLSKWTQYERPLDKLIACCNIMKEEQEA